MSAQTQNRSWADVFRAFKNPKVFSLIFLGISAGIPILLIFSTLSYWLREAGVGRATIGFLSWAALAYAFKFVWAPLIDKLPVPVLSGLMGRRRSWLLVSQLMIIASLLLIARSDPVESLAGLAVFAIMLGFSSATQDIVIDAYRIEAADVDLQGILSSSYIAGYRIGMIIAGAGALKLASFFDGGNGYSLLAWSKTYMVMAASMGIGVITTLMISEPVPAMSEENKLQGRSNYFRFLGCFICCVAAFITVFLISSELVVQATELLTSSMEVASRLAGFLVESVRFGLAVVAATAVGWALIKLEVLPKQFVTETYLGYFHDFFRRYGKAALIILLLISTYRIADIVMGVMANVFYLDMGFSKDEIADITKIYGLVMTIVGGFLGGALAIRYGVIKALFAGAILAATSNLLFAVLAQVGNDVTVLMVVISVDNLSAGIASAAFVAYLSSLTSTSFTASQYALFSSIMVLLPKILAGYSGVMVESIGYEWFFVGTAAMGLPVLILIWLVSRRA